MRRVRRLLAGPLLLAALIAPSGAQAAFPGANGPIVIGVHPYAKTEIDRIDTFASESATTPVPLLTEVGKLGQFEFSADGSKLLGRYVRIDSPVYGSGGYYTADPKGTELTRAVATNSVFSAHFLPDGRVLYLQGRSLRQVNADGSGDVAVLPGVELPRSGTSFVVAPDGGSIYFQTAGWDTVTDQIRQLDLVTGTMTTLLELPPKRSDFPTAFVQDVSPSNTQLLLGIETDATISGGDSIAPAALFVLDLVPQAVPRRLPTVAGTRPGGLYSPDGKKILYVGTNSVEDAGQDSGVISVHTINVDGTGDRELITYPQSAQNGINGIAWQPEASNLSGTVHQRTCRPTSCSLKGLAGVTVTATQPGAAPVVGTTGEDGTYAIGVGAGAWTVKPSLRDAIFDPKSRKVTVGAAPVKDVDFLTCGPSPEDADEDGDTGGARLLDGFLKAVQPCPPDYIVDAVEITQRVQAAPSWFDKGPTVLVPGEGKAESGVYRLAGGDPHYRATRLVKGVSTIVKVYVRVGPGHENVAVEPVQAAAYANGQKLADLKLISKPKALNDLASINTRRIENDVYVFAVPQSVLNAGQFMVAAEILPAKNRECRQSPDGKACRLNNRWALTGIKAVTTRPLDVSVVGVQYATVEAGTRRTRQTVVSRWARDLEGLAEDYLPLKPGDLHARDARVTIDTVPVVKANQAAWGLTADGILEHCLQNFDCSVDFVGAFNSWTRRKLPQPYPLHPWAGQPFQNRGGADGGTTDRALNRFPRISIVSPNPRTMLHELLHQAGSGQLGLNHASANVPCGGSSDNEPWPDDRGSIVGVGSRESLGRWTVLDPRDWYDVMSYCAANPNLGWTINDTWISPLHWNRLVDLWRSTGLREASAAPAPAPVLLAGPRLRVFAVLTGNGSPPLVDVADTTEAATPSAATGTITVTAYDAAGAVLAQVRAVDQAPQTRGGVVDVVLPVAAIARLEAARDGTTPSVAAASANAPTVVLTSPKVGTRVRPRTALTVSWTMADADGDALRSSVEYSADDGKTWRYLAETSDETTLTLARGTLTTSTKARIRVTVTDGLRSTAATSGRLRVTGAPPTLELGTKATVRTTRRVAVTLSASAGDTLGQPLAGSRLRWFDGRKAIGRGASITVRYATKGTRTLRVVATDRWNASTTRTVRVVVG